MPDVEVVQLYKPRVRRKKDSPRLVKRKVKAKGVSKLVKELDVIFSRFLRLSGADKEGIVSCYTCGHKNHWKKMQNGHYVSRFYKATRWNEDNCKIQCVMCNMWKRGDLITFRTNLVEELGEGGVRYLEESRKVSEKLNAETLSAKIAHYTEELKRLDSGLV